MENHGTVFLDKIEELSFALQAKLLQVLQEHEIQRVGSAQAYVIKYNSVWVDANPKAQGVQAARIALTGHSLPNPSRNELSQAGQDAVNAKIAITAPANRQILPRKDVFCFDFTATFALYSRNNVSRIGNGSNGHRLEPFSV